MQLSDGLHFLLRRFLWLCYNRTNRKGGNAMEDWKRQPLGEDLCIISSPRHGFGTDACLLAHFTAPKHKDRVCDLCSGCGVVPLLMQRYYAPAQLVGVEISAEAAGQYRTAIRESGLEETHQAYEGDLRRLPKAFWEQFDVVSCNPPYFSAGTGKQSRVLEHRMARHEEGCTLEEVCQAAGRLLKYGGRFCLCQRPQRLAEVFSAMIRAGLEPKRLLLVSKQWNTAPWLALVEGKKGAAAGLTVLPLLALYDENGLRPEAAAWVRME